jgi:hypothetical protein
MKYYAMIALQVLIVLALFLMLVSFLIRQVNKHLQKKITRLEDIEIKHKLESLPKVEDKKLVMMYVHGWVSLSCQKLLELNNTKHALNELRAMITQWVGYCDVNWFRSLHSCTKSQLVAFSVILNNVTNEDRKIAVKRNLTASAVLFNFSIPMDYWHFDEETSLIICKYLILCDRVKIDINKYTLDDYAHYSSDYKRFSLLVEQMVQQPQVCNVVASMQRTPNFWCLYESVMTKNLKEKVGEVSPIVFKKILTILYLNIGISIPLDYLYMDVEVFDYLNKTGKYKQSGVEQAEQMAVSGIRDIMSLKQ